MATKPQAICQLIPPLPFWSGLSLQPGPHSLPIPDPCHLGCLIIPVEGWLVIAEIEDFTFDLWIYKRNHSEAPLLPSKRTKREGDWEGRSPSMTWCWGLRENVGVSHLPCGTAECGVHNRIHTSTSPWSANKKWTIKRIECRCLYLEPESLLAPKHITSQLLLLPPTSALHSPDSQRGARAAFLLWLEKYL